MPSKQPYSSNILPTFFQYSSKLLPILFSSSPNTHPILIQHSPNPLQSAHRVLVEHDMPPRARAAADSDFVKRKIRVGKNAPPSATATTTVFRARRVRLIEQRLVGHADADATAAATATAAAGDEDAAAAASGQAQFIETNQLFTSHIIQQLGHYAAVSRRAALQTLLTRLKKQPMPQFHIAQAVECLGPLMADEEGEIRKLLLTVLRQIIVDGKQWTPFLPLLTGFVAMAATHMNIHVRRYAINYIMMMMKIFKQDMLTYRETIIGNVLTMLAEPAVLVATNGEAGEKHTKQLLKMMKEKQIMLECVEMYLSFSASAEQTNTHQRPNTSSILQEFSHQFITLNDVCLPIATQNEIQNSSTSTSTRSGILHQFDAQVATSEGVQVVSPSSTSMKSCLDADCLLPLLHQAWNECDPSSVVELLASGNTARNFELPIQLVSMNTIMRAIHSLLATSFGFLSRASCYTLLDFIAHVFPVSCTVDQFVADAAALNISCSLVISRLMSLVDVDPETINRLITYIISSIESLRCRAMDKKIARKEINSSAGLKRKFSSLTEQSRSHSAILANGSHVFEVLQHLLPSLPQSTQEFLLTELASWCCIMHPATNVYPAMLRFWVSLALRATETKWLAFSPLQNLLVLQASHLHTVSKEQRSMLIHMFRDLFAKHVDELRHWTTFKQLVVSLFSHVMPQNRQEPANAASWDYDTFRDFIHLIFFIPNLPTNVLAALSRLCRTIAPAGHALGTISAGYIIDIITLRSDEFDAQQLLSFYFSCLLVQESSSSGEWSASSTFVLSPLLVTVINELRTVKNSYTSNDCAYSLSAAAFQWLLQYVEQHASKPIPGRDPCISLLTALRALISLHEQPGCTNFETFAQFTSKASSRLLQQLYEADTAELTRFLRSENVAHDASDSHIWQQRIENAMQLVVQLIRIDDKVLDNLLLCFDKELREKTTREKAATLLLIIISQHELHNFLRSRDKALLSIWRSSVKDTLAGFLQNSFRVELNVLYGSSSVEIV